MMKSINKKYNILSFLAFAILFGCSDDTFYRTGEDGELDGNTVEAYLSLKVSDFNVQSSATRADSPVTDEANKEQATADENKIDNIWVFQYGADGNQLIPATYYTISDQAQLNNIKVLLKDGVPSTVCVVANTANSQWAKGDGFKTLEGLKKQAIPQPVSNNLFTEFKAIPMEGTKDNVTVASNSKVEVQVYRMYAKLKISFDKLPEGMTPKSIQVNNIPDYCQVHTLGDGVAEITPASYGETVEWVTRSVNAASGEGAYTDGKEYVVYIPENLQGEMGSEFDKKSEITADNQSDRVPGKALVIVMDMNYKDPETGATRTLTYTVYPGGNIYNNFNVRRNCVYRVKMQINTASQEIYTPSSNCIVVIPGETVSFEPYYRTEIGGGYKFEDYLNPNDEEKKINRVGIIWQTFDAIGDNSEGNLVTFTLNEQYPIHSTITVKTKMEGNALIAAYNSSEEIVWSWHIWITGNDPGNVGNAVVYTTYRWDSTGIKSNEPRIPGYAVMPCNIGALANNPEDSGNENTPDNWYCKEKRAYGMLFQWGRKDPFPPMKRATRYSGAYNYDNAVVEVFDNSLTKINMTTNGYVAAKDELFNTVLTYDASKNPSSVIGSSSASGIAYTIKHPTIHIAGATQLGTSYNTLSRYINMGNWLPENDQCLWGAIEIVDPTNAEKYSPYSGRAIWRNYGADKTIFDPCPSGWRVPPGDLWLGFTYNGLNAGNMTTGNYRTLSNIPDYCDINYLNTYFGYWLCLDGWHTTDKTKHSFFPTQGSRMASGEPVLGSICGNYHNATPDLQDKSIQRVNILHLHNQGQSSIKINTFETDIVYYNKSVAGPVRCVRDRK